MGKDHKSNKTSKNIFKVAGSRSFKAKNKAKPVSTQLKKLNKEIFEVNKRHIAEIDKQLNLLEEEVRQQSSKIEKSMNKEPSRLSSNEDIKQYEENELKSSEALEKLTEMSMDK